MSTKQGKYLASRPRPSMTIPSSKPELEIAWLQILAKHEGKPSIALEAAIICYTKHILQ
jgi:hypothetical protein